jgi:predicted membrane-bound spermidine synthase
MHGTGQPEMPQSPEPESYPIPGGLGGWSPELAPAIPVVQKTTARDEPRRRGPRREAAPRSVGDWWALAGFNWLVFVSSVCVMTLELTASRLIAKHVGSSLYTWTSVIGVVLAGITVGNYIGGWLADRFDRSRTLAWMYLLASFSCTSVLWLDQLVAGISRPESLSWPMWVLCVVALIFFAPALALGTTSPLVASMALARSTRTGLTVGNVYAWGALGSIVGTFLTGFYLIDVWGTRAIVGLTAAVLALLAVGVAGSRWVFRTAVLVGWLQFLSLCVAAATTSQDIGGAWGSRVGKALSWFSDEKTAAARVDRWRIFGENFAGKLHEIGLLLKLRDDQPGVYTDESSYSYIRVDDDYSEGSLVRYLRLDKLIHSYYEPDNPTALHYEYEQVYAAVTKQAVERPSAPATVTVPPFPAEEAVLAHLPAGVHFEPATRRLTVEQLTGNVIEELLQLSADAPYWAALERLHKETNVSNWGGYTVVPLDELPAGTVIPADLFQVVRYDATLQVLTAYAKVSRELRDRLINLSPQHAWRTAVEALRQHTGNISALFLGGGGYVFPRWLAAEFPGTTRIDVAELDPAVYRAVQAELGLTPADEQRIHTTIGDARNFVEDRVQDNRRRRAAGQPPVLYDFIYGDAFNDFSVPFHLTTLEFNRKLRELLSPRGIVQQNIIDIYPRTEVPGGTVGVAEVDYGSPLPEAVLVSSRPGAVPKLLPRWAPLEVVPSTPHAPLRLRTTRELTVNRELELLQAAPQDAAWTTAIKELAARSRDKRLLPVPLPAALKAAQDWEQDWTPCPEPFAGVETYRVGQNDYVLGFRGAVSDALRQRLIALDPENPRWVETIEQGVRASRAARPGRFLARYVQTAAAVFPCVYVFSTSRALPHDDRDTYVVVCAQQPLDLKNLSATGLWSGQPFASLETTARGTPQLSGQMDSLLELSGRIVLSDDYAPVDNLLKPVFALQD